jgi:hypothetical protein
MPVIPINKVADEKRIKGGEEEQKNLESLTKKGDAQGVTVPPPQKKYKYIGRLFN